MNANELVVQAPYHPGYEDVGFKQAIRHKEPSYICSLDDDVKPNDFLMQTMILAVHQAWRNEITDIDETKPDSMFYNVFPGEHYRLLKALIKGINPKHMVEIGTYTGMGTIAMRQGSETASLSTFDIIPWDEFDTHLKYTDAVQYVGDLSHPETFAEHFYLLNDADFLFVDAPKDGKFEYAFAELLTQLTPREKRVIMFDDIRFNSMMLLWRGVKSPKLDISSFGHWSGTGIVDASEGFKWEKI